MAGLTLKVHTHLISYSFPNVARISGLSPLNSLVRHLPDFARISGLSPLNALVRHLPDLLHGTSPAKEAKEFLDTIPISHLSR